MPRDIVQLICQECRRKNYNTTKDKRKKPEKLQLKKFCKFCRIHTIHRESR